MKGFLVFLLIASVIFNVFLLMFERTPKDIQLEKIPDVEMRQIREIAIACGSDPARVSNTSAKELLSDIKGTLMNAEPYYGSALEDNDLSTVRSYMNNKTSILKIIESQNKFVLGLKGKKILILPQGDK